MAAVADLDVASRRRAGGWSGRRPPSAGSPPSPAGSSASTQAWVSTSAESALVVAGAARTGSPRRSARAIPWRRSSSSARCAKSWQTPAPASSRSLDRRADVGHARRGTRSGPGSARPAGAASPAASRARRGRRARRAPRVGLASRPAAGTRPPPRRRRASSIAAQARLRRLVRRPSSRTRARTSIERCSCGREIPNSITGRAEVVEVLVQARLGVDADAEVVDALRRASSPA